MRNTADRPDDEEIAFGGLQAFPRLGLLMRGGRKVEIGQRAFNVLLALLEADGAVLTKDELLARIWPNDLVDENNLQAQVSALRRALGPDRDIIDTVFGRGYRLLPPDGPACRSLPGDASAAHVPGLCAGLSPLIGREDDLASLTEAIASGALVTIGGAGGIGKTRLALELGRRLQADFSDGVILVELAEVAGPGLVLPTILAKLGIGIGLRQLPRETRAALNERRVLLILDNCEHLLDEVVAAIGNVLQLLPRTRICATTREPLGIDGEQVFRLAPLGLPPARVASLDEAMQYPSVQLLVQRIRAAESRFRLGEAHAEGLCAVCRRLDGIPLALELAAARVSQVGLGAVVTGLGDRLGVLTAGRRTAIPRHQTLRATLDWSYGLLTCGQQVLLQQLGVFAGSFTLEAAAAIACPGTGNIWRVADLLGGLEAKSMILKDIDGADAKFRLLETVRAFALEQLVSPADLRNVASRHAAYFRSRLVHSAKILREGSCDAWLREFATDLSDVRAALDWTFANDDPSEGIRSLCASLPFWMQLSLLGECRERVACAIKRFEHVLRDEPRLEMQLRAALGASTTWACGPIVAAGAAWLRALEVATHLDEREQRLQSYYGLWLYTLRSGAYAEALDWGETLMREGFANGDREAEAAGRRTAGVAHHFLGNHARAAEMIRSVVEPAHADRAGRELFALRFGLDQRTAALAFLARVYCVQGEFAQARDTAGQAVEAAKRLGHVLTLCCALLEGGCTVAALNSDHGALHRHAVESVRIAETHGLEFWRLYGQAYLDLAVLMREPGPTAVRRLLDTVSALREIRFDLGYTVIVLRLTEILVILDRPIEGSSLIHDLIGRQAVVSLHWAGPEILRIKAGVVQKIGGPNATADARALLAEALGLARAQGARAWEHRITHDLLDVDRRDYIGQKRNGCAVT